MGCVRVSVCVFTYTYTCTCVFASFWVHMCVQMHMHMYYKHTKVKAEFLDHWGRVSRWSQSSPIEASLDSQLTQTCLVSSSLLGLQVTVMPPGHWVGSRDPEYKVRQALYSLSHLPRTPKVYFEISVPEILCVSQPVCSVARWFFCHPSQRPPKERLAEHGCYRWAIVVLCSQHLILYTLFNLTVVGITAEVRHSLEWIVAEFAMTTGHQDLFPHSQVFMKSEEQSLRPERSDTV